MGVITVLAIRKSQLTGKSHSREIAMTPEQYQRYRYGGEYIQDILPDLSADDREFLISGITPEEWADMLPPEEG